MAITSQLQEVAQLLKTERAQVILIMLLIAATAFATVKYVVIPQHDMTQNNLIVREQLEQSRYAKFAIEDMLQLVEQERQTLGTLSNAWGKISERLATFPIQETSAGREVNLIDYRVNLYDIRERLKAKSQELKIQLLPGDLGLTETINSSEAIRVRMLQLRAVEKLADLTLDRQIQRLVEIYPLEPVAHHDSKGCKIFEEYPVRLECDVDYEHLYTLFQSIFEEHQIFTFRNVRVEAGPTFDAKLRVKAVLSALLFD